MYIAADNGNPYLEFILLLSDCESPWSVRPTAWVDAGDRTTRCPS
jgi:hypothetical protein